MSINSFSHMQILPYASNHEYKYILSTSLLQYTYFTHTSMLESNFWASPDLLISVLSKSRRVAGKEVLIMNKKKVYPKIYKCLSKMEISQ